MKEIVLTVEAESFGRDPEGNDLEVRKLGNDPTARDISILVNSISNEILAYSKDSYEICYEVAHKQFDST